MKDLIHLIELIVVSYKSESSGSGSIYKISSGVLISEKSHLSPGSRSEGVRNPVRDLSCTSVHRHEMLHHPVKGGQRLSRVNMAVMKRTGSRLSG